jgi:hypothetical protein
MKVRQTELLTDEELEENDFRESYTLEVVKSDGTKIRLCFADGEPEDATLARDFNDVFSIETAIIAAYEAGKAGEELEFETINS